MVVDSAAFAFRKFKTTKQFKTHVCIQSNAFKFPPTGRSIDTSITTKDTSTKLFGLIMTMTSSQHTEIHINNAFFNIEKRTIVRIPLKNSLTTSNYAV